MRLLCVCRHRNMNLINSPHPTGNWSWKSCACLCSTGRKMMRLLCLCVHRNMNVIIPPHPTPPTPPHPPHPTGTWKREDYLALRIVFCISWKLPASMCADDRSLCADDAVSLCADDSFAMCADDSLSMCADDALTVWAYLLPGLWSSSSVCFILPYFDTYDCMILVWNALQLFGLKPEAPVFFTSPMCCCHLICQLTSPHPRAS